MARKQIKSEEHMVDISLATTKCGITRKFDDDKSLRQSIKSRQFALRHISFISVLFAKLCEAKNTFPRNYPALN